MRPTHIFGIAILLASLALPADVLAQRGGRPGNSVEQERGPQRQRPGTGGAQQGPRPDARRHAESRTPEQRPPERRSPEQQRPEQQRPEQQRPEQQRPGQVVPEQRPREQRLPDNRGEAMPEQQRGRHAGDWLRRYKDVPPADQQRALEQDQNFQKLPERQQRRLRDRLEWFNNLPPQRQERVLNNLDRLKHMSPDERARVHEMGRRFRELPQPRRRAMFNALGRLRNMPPEQRQKVMESEQFRNAFSEQEREMLRRMSQLDGGDDSEDGPEEPH